MTSSETCNVYMYIFPNHVNNPNWDGKQNTKRILQIIVNVCVTLFSKEPNTSRFLWEEFSHAAITAFDKYTAYTTLHCQVTRSGFM